MRLARLFKKFSSRWIHFVSIVIQKNALHRSPPCKIIVVTLLLLTQTEFSIAELKVHQSNSSAYPFPSTEIGKIRLNSNESTYWITKADQSALLQLQFPNLVFHDATNGYPIINVDDTQTFQTIDGFGYTLTGSSALVINSLYSSERHALLEELFSHTGNSIGVSYIRLSMGASDLSPYVYSYDDMPIGQTDVNLQYFNLSYDKENIIPILKEIISINPSIKIIATPWSAPSWMKSNNSSIGGILKLKYYPVYARYFQKYIESMKQEGITIDAVTPQNEPLNPNNNPSMTMSANEQTNFIKNYLGPTLRQAGLNTKIITYDHNCDRPDYPISVLSDSVAKQYIDGSAFHLYAGSITALSKVYNAYPDRNIYFTEQYTAATGNFGGDLNWHIKNVIIGATRNYSRNVLEWNLANDPQFGPHTPGGCSTCKGALTIGSQITRNVSYYIIAHASKFVLPGSVRIQSSDLSTLKNVAFKRPDGVIVLIVLNDSNGNQTFNIRYQGKIITPTLPGRAVATFIW